MSARKYRVYHHLQLAAHRAQKLADRRIAERTHLTTAQAAVLAVLDSGEGETQKDVANALGLNESAVTAMVNRLMRLGYLDRTRSADDGRAWVLRATGEGIANLRQAGAAFAHVNRIIDAELSANEVKQLAGYLQRLARAFAESEV